MKCEPGVHHRVTLAVWPIRFAGYRPGQGRHGLSTKRVETRTRRRAPVLPLPARCDEPPEEHRSVPLLLDRTRCSNCDAAIRSCVVAIPEPAFAGCVRAARMCCAVQRDGIMQSLRCCIGSAWLRLRGKGHLNPSHGVSDASSALSLQAKSSSGRPIAGSHAPLEGSYT